MIVKLSPHKWQVQSEKGKNLGTYKTEKEAKRRLQQVEYFKHKNHSEDQKYFVSLKNFEDKTFAHVKGPVYGFDEAKEALINLMLANKEDFSEGIIRPWQSEDIIYRVQNFDFKDTLNKIDPDILKSADEGKEFIKASLDNGPKQLVKTIKDPKNYRVYAKEAATNIKSSIKNIPALAKRNPRKLISSAIALPVSAMASISPIPGTGLAAGIASYVIADYAQRKLIKMGRLASSIAKNIKYKPIFKTARNLI